MPARIRSIKPEFYTNWELFEAEDATGLPLRVAYAGLWSHCDREGRFHWEPRRLKLGILPFDQVDMGDVLDALVTYGFLVHYACSASGDASATREYGWVPTFTRHQVLNPREKASQLPPFEATSSRVILPSTTRGSRVDHASARVVQGSDTRENETESREEEREREEITDVISRSESPVDVTREPGSCGQMALPRTYSDAELREKFQLLKGKGATIDQAIESGATGIDENSTFQEPQR